MRAEVTSIPCPACGASVGEWCERHGKIQPGPLLTCVARVRATSLVACPVSDLTGERHTFTPGSGIQVPWAVMGDPRESVVVCPNCGSHADMTG